jgi:hypothetical protein
VQGASIYVRKVQEKKELPEWRENLWKLSKLKSTIWILHSW